VSGRHEPGHRADPVDVGLQQRRERVLHAGGQHHHDQGLHPDEAGLPGEQPAQHEPGRQGEHHLTGGLGTGGQRNGVGEQDRRDERHHDRADGQVPPVRHDPSLADAPGPDALGGAVAPGGHNDGVRISAKTDYAIRAAAQLASAREAGTWTRTEAVSIAQGIPLPFLQAILAELRSAGLVQSRRGVDGGYRLAHAPQDVTVADVIRAVDGPLANIAGSRPEDVAYDGAATHLRDVWVALRATMRTVLEGVTLADLVDGTLPAQVGALLADEGAWRARR
jgi:Rrf2 family protein